MDRSSILTTANSLVTGERAQAYGDAHEHLAKVGKMWEQVLGVEVDADQVALCMILLKVSRAAVMPEKPDNWVDIAGYSALGGELADGIETATRLAAVDVTLPAPVPATTGHIEIVLPPDPIEAYTELMEDEPRTTRKK